MHFPAITTKWEFSCTVETRYKEFWYYEIPDITSNFSSQNEINLFCFVLFIDYWYNKVRDITSKMFRSQGPRYKEFPLYYDILILFRGEFMWMFSWSCFTVRFCISAFKCKNFTGTLYLLQLWSISLYLNEKMIFIYRIVYFLYFHFLWYAVWSRLTTTISSLKSWFPPSK